MGKNVVKLSLAAVVLAVGFSGCAKITEINQACMDKGYVGYKYIDETLSDRRNNHNILYPQYGLKAGMTKNLLVNFQTNSANIEADSYGKIKAFAKEMMQNMSLKALIAGYTDSRGTEEYNLGLSQRRADAVAKQIVKDGVSSSRISAKGYGEANPVATNETPEGRRANRRIEAQLR